MGNQKVNVTNKNILVIALGNDLLGDDGVGFVAARQLKADFDQQVDFVETGETGLALIEFMEGYNHVLLLDSISNSNQPYGTVIEYSPHDFQKIIAPSPHYAGLPEILQLSTWFNIDFPEDIRILTIQIGPSIQFRDSLNPQIYEPLAELVSKARQILRIWLN